MFDGAKVRARRIALGLSQTQLAALMGIGACTICKIEAGGKKLSLELAERVALALRCKVNDLLYGIREVGVLPV